MSDQFYNRIEGELAQLKQTGTYKVLRHLESPMDAHVQMEGRGELLVLCSNNYLGLSNCPEVIEAGKAGLDRLGAGTASVRFICGTFDVHRELEQEIAGFLNKEAALTYVSCWNANTGLIPTIAGPEDALISDELNHASIIDGCRWAGKVRREIFAHSNMAVLEEKLKATQDARTRFVLTDGVFSMEGDLARLPEMAALARQYDAVTIVDDSHGTGVLGKTGRGTAEHFGVEDQIDIIISTLGKALGGAAGGFVAGRASLVDYLGQRSRPQLFSNALPPTVACSALAAIRYLEAHPELTTSLQEKTAYFRQRLNDIGFEPLPGESAIIPIIVGDTARAIRISELLLDKGIYVTGFGYPVVPEGKARIRVQISAALSCEDMDRALAAFQQVGKEVGLL